MYLDSSQFPIVNAIEAAFAAVRDECLAIPHDAFDPWVQKSMYGSGWDVYGLLAWGERIPGSLQTCPRTAALLESLPGIQTAGFSRLRAGAHIQPHSGWVTNVYRLHLGLVIPPNCGMTVAGETRAWIEGKCLVFDDTSMHEAWNKSDSDRLILLLDFLRPGCTADSSDQMPVEVQMELADKLKRERSSR